MSQPEVLVVGCGALARELAALTRDVPGVEVALLPALLHNRPDRIPDAVRARVRAARAHGIERVFVAYADCGTGGRLDHVCAEEGVERLPGAHCYEVYAGAAAFAALQDEEPGTFYLTDFLVRAFEPLVWRGLGLDRHPGLRDVYFANYRRVVYLAQAPDPDLVARARTAAARLGLDFELRETGLGGLAQAVDRLARAPGAPKRPAGGRSRRDRAREDTRTTDLPGRVRAGHTRSRRGAGQVRYVRQAHIGPASGAGGGPASGAGGGPDGGPGGGSAAGAA